MKLLMSLLIVALVSQNASAQHSEQDFTKGNFLTYKELVAYLDLVGWDQVHYAHNTGIAMIFVKGKAASGKDIILYYWKGFRGQTDADGNLLIDRLDTPSEHTGAGGSSFAGDDNTNLIMDLAKINPNSFGSMFKFRGFRGMIYDNENSQAGKVLSVQADGGSVVAKVFPNEMLLRKITRMKDNKEFVMVDSPNVTGAHILSQHYGSKNYSDHTQNIVLPVE